MRREAESRLNNTLILYWEKIQQAARKNQDGQSYKKNLPEDLR